ncbi:MAG: MarR family transcriptional regulator [Legionellaceae bacterium]|jgi:predicted transcriptional regulator|nr:MarR family transcriptional regulator [Legionellaceae bacterium]
MKILKVGIMPRENFQKRLIDIASGQLKPKKNEPKIWFSSIKSLGEVLSENNLHLLKIIDEKKPDSIKELAYITHRQPGNLSRTLKTMERYGIVEFKKSGKNSRPIAKALGFNIEYNALLAC